MNEEQKKILQSWYVALDQEFGEHGDSESPCGVCTEAYELGIIEEREPDNE